MPDTPSTVERVYPPKLMFTVVDPIMRWVLSTRLGDRLPELAKMEFTGRKSGRDLAVVVATHDLDGRTAVLTNSGWRHNFRNGHPVEMVRGTERHRYRGVLEDDPETVAEVYARRIEELGTDQAARRLGIKVHGDGVPSRDQLVDLTRREGLSVIYLEPPTA